MNIIDTLTEPNMNGLCMQRLTKEEIFYCTDKQMTYQIR